MEIKSVQKYVTTSPRKLREVVALAKTLKPTVLLEQLPFLGKKAAEPLRKVVATALANAKSRGLNEKDLVFKEIQINEGPRFKRFRAGARGRVKPYKRRTSHIRVVLETKELKNEKTKELKNEKSQGAGKESKEKVGSKSAESAK